MAATDITESVVRMNGVNQETQYKKSDAYIIDAAANAGLLTVATHSLVSIPAGNMVTGVKAVLLGAATSSGSATLQLLAKVGSETAEAFSGTAFAVAAMTAGKVYNLPISAVTAYSETDATVIQATVGTAAFTALKFMLIVEYIPIVSFLNRG